MDKNFFSPVSICVIGATVKKNKLGYTVLYNIISSGFKGKIYPVNPRYKKILGKKCFPSVLDIPQKVQTAVIIVPASVTPTVLAECGKKKVKNVIIITAGFSESGKNGKGLESELKEIAEKYHIDILGPNCLGILSSQVKLNASFSDGMIQKGDTAFLSQSGAILTAMLDFSHTNNLGFSHFVSLGNKLGLDEVDFLQTFKKDTKTKVILGYLESIERGREFVDIASVITLKKPMVFLKPGKTESGRKAALSHTASLAGDDRAVEAAFRSANITRAENLQDFFDLTMMFSWSPEMSGNRVCIIGNAGGPSVISSDSVNESCLTLSKLSDESVKSLQENLPPAASIYNPVDVIGDANAERYKTALDVAYKDKNVDALVIILTPQSLTEVSKTAKLICQRFKKYKKPTVVSFIGGKKVAPGNKILSEGRVPHYKFPHQAVRVLEKWYVYHRNKNIDSVGQLQYKKIMLSLEEYSHFSEKIQESQLKNLQQLPFFETQALLKSYEIDLVSQSVVSGQDEIRKIESLQFPVVAKTINDHILHRTDGGFVITDIQNLVEASKAYEELTKKLRSQSNSWEDRNILFQKQLRVETELIIGAKRDTQFGPLIMFGFGGVYTESFDDVSFRISPVSKTDALRMIEETKIYKILSGQRGKEHVDFDVLAGIINKISQLMMDFPGIDGVDLNPIIVDKEGKISAVDFKILVKGNAEKTF